VTLVYNGAARGGSVIRRTKGRRRRGATGGYVPLVEVWRGDVVESLHHGAIVVADDAGRRLAAVGAPDTVTFLRSSAKPVQILPLLQSGAAERFGFTDEEIAVMAGSHGGEPFHLAAVRSVLARIGVGEDALQCGAHAPYHRPSARALRAAGTTPTAIHNNCSGKHAGMLALAVALGADIRTYLEPDHPVQKRIRRAILDLSGAPPAALRTAVDGCSAPTFALPLSGAARLYARLLAPERAPAGLGAAIRRATGAMRRHPEMVAGTGRLCTRLMRLAGDGLIAKIGAEGVYGLGFARHGRGIGIILKIADGDGERARPLAAIETLRQLQVIDANQATELRAEFVPDQLNRRGIKVGKVAPIFDLALAPERRSPAGAGVPSGANRRGRGVGSGRRAGPGR
jgi:L-asparaginase II